MGNRNVEFFDGQSTATAPKLEPFLIDDWVTATVYYENQIVTESNKIYRCTATGDGQTSTVFATDLGNSWWEELSGAGSVAMADLTDVESAGISSGQVLIYTSDSSKYIPGDIATDMASITDVEIGGISSGQTLIYTSDSSVFIPGNLTTDLNSVTDVEVGGVSSGQYLMYTSDSAVWIANTPPGGVSALNDLSDVTLTTPANKSVLYTADGTNWIDQVLSIDDMSDVIKGTPNNNDILVYNSSSGAFLSQAPSSGGTGDLVEWSSGSWSSGNTVIDMANGGIYQCVAAHTSSTDTDLSADWSTGAWTLVSKDNTIPLYSFYVADPDGTWASVGQFNGASATDYATWASIWSSRDGSKLFSVGGDNQSWANNLTYTCDLSTDPTAWSTSGAVLNQGRLQGCLYVDEVRDLVYYIGGTANGSANVGTVEVINRDGTGSWSCLGTMSSSFVNRDCPHYTDGSGLMWQFGGDGGTTRILCASLSDPLNWDSVGVLPFSVLSGTFQRVGNYGYIFGDYDSSTILRAPMSNLTSWSSVGEMVTSTIARYVRTMIAGNTIFATFGTPTQQEAVYTASTSDPLTWSSTGVLTDGVLGAMMYVYDGYCYVAGGTTPEVMKSPNRSTQYTAQTSALDITLRSDDERARVNAARGILTDTYRP